MEGENVIIVIGRDDDGNFVYEDKMRWEGIIFKNNGTSTDCSFGHFLLGKDFGWHPDWFELKSNPAYEESEANKEAKAKKRQQKKANKKKTKEQRAKNRGNN